MVATADAFVISCSVLQHSAWYFKYLNKTGSPGRKRHYKNIEFQTGSSEILLKSEISKKLRFEEIMIYR